MKNAGMAGAVALVGIGLVTIGLSNFSNRAEAVPSAAVAPGPDETGLVFVVDTALASDPIGGYGSDQMRPTQVFRLWSNGAVDFMNLSNAFYEQGGCDPTDGFEFYCDGATFDAWQPFHESLSGFLPRYDMNGDRRVDAEDLGLILANWGPTSAALLFNPSAGSESPIALACDWIQVGHPPSSNAWDLTVYRSWDSGLIEMAWVTDEIGACLRNAQACWEGWAPMPETLPISQATGDFDRSGATDASDLGGLLSGWRN